MTTAADLRHAVFERSLRSVEARTSQTFFWLLIAQWMLAIVLALTLSPYTWNGMAKSVHVHVCIAIIFGGVVNALPLVLIRTRPTWWLTRHCVAATQMVWSAILIQVTGGRIETHFHVFGSLAFVAFYRDWRVLVTATAVVAADHLARGLLWPESVYGIANPEWWRFLEHAGWMVFEDTVLALACLRAIAEMKVVADREVALVEISDRIEERVHLRTRELAEANLSLATEMNARLAMEVELRQAQKLESVGRLASGVAHEINTPIQFINDSVHFARDAVDEIFVVIDKLDIVQRSVLAGSPALDAAHDAAAAQEAADLAYLKERVPQAMIRALDGLDRVSTIVRSLKEFAHPDQKEMSTVDLNRAVQSTLTMAGNEYKYVADLEIDLGELPQVRCHVGDLNQAVLNIVVNAAHAVSDVVQNTSARGAIRVRTRVDGDDAVISIEDTGGGIPEAVREHIFDPFFTTKEVGKGTGQGLAIARSVVVDKHRGTLTFATEPGKGTTFFIRVPIAGHRIASLVAVSHGQGCSQLPA